MFLQYKLFRNRHLCCIPNHTIKCLSQMHNDKMLSSCIKAATLWSLAPKLGDQTNWATLPNNKLHFLGFVFFCNGFQIHLNNRRLQYCIHILYHNILTYAIQKTKNLKYKTQYCIVLVHTSMPFYTFAKCSKISLFWRNQPTSGLNIICF